MKTKIIIFSIFLTLLTSCQENKGPIASGPLAVVEEKREEKKEEIKEEVKEVKKEEEEVEVMKEEELPVIPIIKVKENRVASITKERSVEFKSDFSNLSEFKENLNKYMIHAELKENPGKGILHCETQSSPHNKIKFQNQFDSGSFGVDLAIDLNKTSSQKEILHCSLENENTVLLSADFEIKKDILFENSEGLNKKMLAGKNEIGALVISEGVELETLGIDYHFQVEQLISSDASIVSFREGQNLYAPNDQDGHSGGNLTINAIAAFGDLKIIMRGQNGGLVTEVPRKVEEIPFVNENQNGLSMQTDWVIGCDDRGDRELCFGSREVTQCPTDGKNGLKGYKGRKGFNGRSGGDSGIVSVSIKDATFFTLGIKLLKGIGSLPGKRGEGGPGSSSGLAGVYAPEYIERCNKIPQNGKAGEKGEDGDQGTVGENGKKERGSYMDVKNNNKLEY